MKSNKLLWPVVFLIGVFLVQMSACAERDCENLLDELPPEALSSGGSQCTFVERTEATGSISDYHPRIFSLCWLAGRHHGPAGVYRVRELVYVLEDPVETEGSTADGVDPLVPGRWREFVFADVELQQAWEEGAASRMWVRLYSNGRWPDEPATDPHLRVGESYLFFPATRDGFSHISEENGFTELEGRWVNGPFTLAIEPERLRERLIEARAWMARADGTLESCPEHLRGQVFE